MCLVFFGSPGATFESVTFQPSLDTAAVTWTGDLTIEKKTSQEADEAEVR